MISLNFLRDDESYFPPNVVDLITVPIASSPIIESYSHALAWLYGGQNVLFWLMILCSDVWLALINETLSNVTRAEMSLNNWASVPWWSTVRLPCSKCSCCPFNLGSRRRYMDHTICSGQPLVQERGETHGTNLNSAGSPEFSLTWLRNIQIYRCISRGRKSVC